MKKTINQIRVELNEIATKHGQINSFAWKDFLRAYKEKELNYPLMCAYYPTSNLTLNQTEIALTIIIADKIFKDWNKNLNEVESDTLQICRDIFNIINQSDRWQRIGRVSSCTVNKFIERGGDDVAGHTMTVNFLIRDNSGVCDIPIFDYDFDQVISAGCPVVNVFNSDLSYSQEVDSGDSLELPDITYNVKNSADTSLKSGTIPSVNNLSVSLDDVNNIDSDGSTVPTPAGVAFTCTPAEDATLTLNTSAFLTVASGSTTDISLIDQNDSDITPISVVGSTIKVNVPVAVTGGLSAFPNQSGQTTSYFTDDDGDLQLGRLVDFYTLSGTGSDWFFGHTRRFTGITGGYHNGSGYVDVNGNATSKALAFPETIVLDWSLYDPVSGNLVGWQYDPFLFSNTDRATAITSATGFSTASFPTGWRLMGIKFLAELPNDGVIPYLNYPPFSDPLGVALWSSTTQNSNSNVGRILRDDTLLNTNSIFTAGARAFPGRIFNTSEL